MGLFRVLQLEDYLQFTVCKEFVFWVEIDININSEGYIIVY